MPTHLSRSAATSSARRTAVNDLLLLSAILGESANEACFPGVVSILDEPLIIGNVHSDGVPLVPLAHLPTATVQSSGVEGSDSQLPFSWTTNADETLLRLRFDSVRRRFQGSKRPKQLAAAWNLLTAEVFRLADLKVGPG
ncbi:hypothetical protein JG687_00013193 [Phytophthora cactorum]|uniref:Uncharacterized protein n=1 Tax=Phytophthora cactorum TaxID=29920 RepID=A0A329R8S2_9STRA|nr:hypothetical protein GQ600_24189 [Phytophthora cactorum]KAF1786104.1 hypothetical protein GQ600_4599 [Phytophthora cactorum]KAG2776618.1 hypothetical protein Pcac1_g12864 [Phytophthora cactorum]KAG2792894.1 hypothetical protein PC111_g23268 [Phytophthora cactorum]KAG2793181.1 hypothetical protein PC112_g23554 [Phytophthora cactorum]